MITRRFGALLLWVGGVLAVAPLELTGAPTCPQVPGETVDFSAIDALFVDLARDPHGDLKGVIITRHGCTLAERYFNGDDSASLHDIRSATKSITSTLVGIAIQQGLVAGMDEPLAQVLPAGMPPSQRRIRLRDVLTMRSGLDADDRDSLAPGNEDRLDRSPDWMAFAYSVPMKRPPGDRYVYSSLNAFLAGAVVEYSSGVSLEVFARRYLFGPIGIHRLQWRRGPRGEGVGQGNLSITVRDMAMVGELFRRGGRAHGRQIVDSAWVGEALAPRVYIGDVDRYADAYGYMWYTKRYQRSGRSIVVHFASGNGGNKIYLVPAYDLVVAITSGAYGRAYGQERSERILLRILDAVDEGGQE